MAMGGFARNALSAAIAGCALLFALLDGAPLAAALLALIGGIVAACLLLGLAEGQRYEAPVATTGLPPLPGAAELLGALDEPLLIVRNRRVLLANAAARAILGPHVEGADVRLAIRHPAAAELLASEHADLGPEDTRRIELVGLGEVDRRWVMTVSPLPNASRLVRLSDRSETHASEKMRTDFVANASHELRTPLATLIGFLETLQDEKAASDPKPRTRFLRIMFDEARRMQQLIEDLISLSRIESERFTLPRESVDLVPLIEEVRTSCHQMIEERDSGIRVRGGDQPRLVLGDRPQLLQLLRNLIVNALKYGRSGTEVTVDFADANAEFLRVSVIDRGEGIAPEHLPRLTERFYRVDPGRSRAVGGTGLGLAIVKHIVGRHRGTLDIRSAPGEGTNVSVLLPKADPDSGRDPAA